MISSVIHRILFPSINWEADSGCKVNKELALSPVNSIFHRHEEHVQKEL